MTGQLTLDVYMNNSIRDMMSNAYKTAGSPKETSFILKMQQATAKAEKRRKKHLQEEGLTIPPFLISSIAADCNLSCKDCYARADDTYGTREKADKKELSAGQWKQIFREAAQMGISFNLLTGGEPLLRKDILKAASEVEDMIFPVFTNGTIITRSYLDFFSEHLNLIPVLSIEGCRGMGKTLMKDAANGFFNRVIHSMELLKDRSLFYGTSITVTPENVDLVTSLSYVKLLRDLGSRIIFYIEYMPTEKDTYSLALGDNEIAKTASNLERLRKQYKDTIFLSFPGDEKAMGGCLAAGRGFLHISPDGRAAAWPFSPYADRNVAQTGLKEALQPPFFAR